MKPIRSAVDGSERRESAKMNESRLDEKPAPPAAIAHTRLQPSSMHFHRWFACIRFGVLKVDKKNEMFGDHLPVIIKTYFYLLYIRHLS